MDERARVFNDALNIRRTGACIQLCGLYATMICSSG